MSGPAPKISINQQIEEIRRVIAETRNDGTRKVSGRKLRQGELDEHLRRQDAIFHTLAFCRDEREVIRAVMAMTPADRAAVVSHGHLVAQLARELARKEAIAKAGGPVR